MNIVKQIDNLEVKNAVVPSLAWTFGSMAADAMLRLHDGEEPTENDNIVIGLYAFFTAKSPEQYRPDPENLVHREYNPKLNAELPEELAERAAAIAKRDAEERQKRVEACGDEVIDSLRRIVGEQNPPATIPAWAGRLILERAIEKTEAALEKALRRANSRSRTLAQRAADEAVRLDSQLKELIAALDELEAA